MKNPLYVLLSPERWNAQYTKGVWKNILHQNALNTEAIALMCIEKAKHAEVRILDVGCGSGALLDMLRKSGVAYRYVGFDFAEAAISQVRISDTTREQVFVEDVRTPSRIEGVFDVIVFNEVLYYVSPSQVLPHYRRLLAPGGTVIISIYNTWRRSIIFLLSAWYLSFTQSTYVPDPRGGRSWVIKTGTFRSL